MKLKTKVWDGKEKEWLDNFEYMITSNGGVFRSGIDIKNKHRSSRYIIFLWTGLRDKNGVEIYGGMDGEDGDIVKWYSEEEDDDVLGVIRWGSASFWIKDFFPDNKPSPFYAYDGLAYRFQWEDLEIIGNTVENPELVEQQKKDKESAKEAIDNVNKHIKGGGDLETLIDMTKELEARGIIKRKETHDAKDIT